MSGVFLYLPPSYILRQVFSLKLQLVDLDCLAREHQESSHLHRPSAGITEAH